MSELERFEREDCEMEMTPMIDVTFLLLIFFMCTLKFKTLEGKLGAYLPKEVGVNPQQTTEPPPKCEVGIDVVEEGTRLRARDGELWAGEGRYVFDDARRLAYRVGPIAVADLDELRQRVEAWYERDPETAKATVDARKGVVYSEVVEILDVLIDGGFEDITFVGSYE